MDTAAVETQPIPENVYQIAPGVETDGPKAVEIKSIEKQIMEHQDAIERLEVQRQKSVVEELALDPDALALVSKHRAKERYPNALKEVEKHIKQLAWSGETAAFLEPSSPIFNDKLIADLKQLGFQAKLISLGANAGFKIEVRWDRKNK